MQKEPWLKWAIELQSIAQCGLTYTKDIFDTERFLRLREIAAEMLSYQGDIPLEKVTRLFCGETGYQTPKLDTRAAVFKDGKILLVHEKKGDWSLPGGWVDVTESVGSNAVKEVKEESGMDVRPVKLIAVQDRDKHNSLPCPYPVCKIFILCELLGGAFAPNSETTEIGYFSLNELPPLAEEKNSKSQVEMCFRAQSDPSWETLFD